jgi:hypothetical protein
MFEADQLTTAAPVDRGLPVLAALSNQTWGAVLGMAEVKRNLPSPILGWTKQEHFLSTNRALGDLSTNSMWPKL